MTRFNQLAAGLSVRVAISCPRGRSERCTAGTSSTVYPSYASSQAPIDGQTLPVI